MLNGPRSRVVAEGAESVVLPASYRRHSFGCRIRPGNAPARRAYGERLRHRPGTSGTRLGTPHRLLRTGKLAQRSAYSCTRTEARRSQRDLLDGRVAPYEDDALRGRYTAGSQTGHPNAWHVAPLRRNLDLRSRSEQRLRHSDDPLHLGADLDRLSYGAIHRPLHPAPEYGRSTVPSRSPKPKPCAAPEQQRSPQSSRR